MLPSASTGQRGCLLTLIEEDCPSIVQLFHADPAALPSIPVYDVVVDISAVAVTSSFTEGQ